MKPFDCLRSLKAEIDSTIVTSLASFHNSNIQMSYPDLCFYHFKQSEYYLSEFVEFLYFCLKRDDDVCISHVYRKSISMISNILQKILNIICSKIKYIRNAETHKVEITIS